MVLILSAISISVLLIVLFWVRGIPSFQFLVTIKKSIVLIAMAEALVLALKTGRALWSILGSVPQQYNDFVAGAIGYSNSTKTIEYYLLLMTVAAFVVFFVVIIKIYDLHSHERAENELVKLSLYALIPAAVMAGQSVQMKNTDYLLTTSMLSVVILLLTICILRILLNKNGYSTRSSL